MTPLIRPEKFLWCFVAAMLVLAVLAVLLTLARRPLPVAGAEQVT